jgi:hypothetical protein
MIAFQLSLFCKNYRFSKTHYPLYNKQKNTWVLGNTRFISRVEHDISLVNKSGISKHPCIILYILRFNAKKVPASMCLHAFSILFLNKISVRSKSLANQILIAQRQIYSNF